jgi:hypothetical protein
MHVVPVRRLHVVLTRTAAVVCQEQAVVDPVVDLAHSKRNAAARRLKDEVDAHIDALSAASGDVHG